MGDKLLVGTRGSRLALEQTRLVLEGLRGPGRTADFEIVPIRTEGDRAPPETGADGKTAFTGDIEVALVEGRIDMAVHSMKDLPAKLDGRLVLAATPRRGDPRDVLVSDAGVTLPKLKRGALIGTSSVRRRSQLLATRPDLEIVGIHGNIETRLRKLSEEGLDGVVLALAGLERLGLGARASQVFEVEEMVPAACQGILAVEARADDRETLSLVRGIDDADTRAASECERAFSEELGGDCNLPVGAHASIDSGRIRAIGMISDLEGRKPVRGYAGGDREDAAELGRSLAARVMDAGGRAILKELGR